jgi:hypothetical protein
MDVNTDLNINGINSIKNADNIILKTQVCRLCGIAQSIPDDILCSDCIQDQIIRDELIAWDFDMNERLNNMKEKIKHDTICRPTGKQTGKPVTQMQIIRRQPNK